MDKENSEHGKRHVTVGTIGYVDHKTTLTAALAAILAEKIGGRAKGCGQIGHAPKEKTPFPSKT